MLRRSQLGTACIACSTPWASKPYLRQVCCVTPAEQTAVCLLGHRFMCGTLTCGTRLSKACMEGHEPEGGAQA